MVGIHLIGRIKGLPEIIQLIAYQSHERENGQGYPKQRKGRLIHDYTKIISVADIFEAMTSERPYRKAFQPYRAMEFILKILKLDYLNNEIVKYYLEYASLFPVGSLVKLSTGEIGKVVKPNGRMYSQPVVSAIADADQRIYTDGEIKTYDLSKSGDINIVQPFDNGQIGADIMRGF
jgi:HD-GYP domain-containing protein (c-di-GMP phosphodiesterase class II)